MISKFDLVIFDLDGVLIDSEVLSCGCLAQMLTRHGVDIDLDEVIRRFLGRSFSVVAGYYAERTGTAMQPSFCEELRDLLLDRFRSGLRAMPHAQTLLDSLSNAYCLASSSDTDRLRASLAMTCLAPYFGGRVFNAAMVERGKPAPDLFLLAAASMGAEPSRTLVLEDSESGVIAGKAAGMTVWGFVGGSHYAGRDGRAMLLAAGADRIVESLAELIPHAAREPIR